MSNFLPLFDAPKEELATEASPPAFRLRDYQQAAIDNAFILWGDGSVGCIARIPTGCGKTITATMAADRWIKQGPEYKVMVFCHERQLVHQFAEEIYDVRGKRPLIEMGDDKITATQIRKAENDIFVCSKMSLWSREIEDAFSGDTIREQPRLDKFDNLKYKWLLIIDELHKYQAGQKSFRHIIEHFRANPACKTLGITATPERGDKKTLAKLTPDIAYDYVLFDIDGGKCAVTDGWAVAYDQRFIVVEGVDFKTIKEVAKDFDEGQLELELTTTEALASCVKPMLEQVGKRSTLIFCVTKAAAKMTAGYINALREEGGTHGEAVEIDGDMPDRARKDTYLRHQKGEFQFLAVCGLCREGYNDPNIAAVAVFRPTKSRPLAEQMKGRGCRPMRGVVNSEMTAEERIEAIARSPKPNCIVVDLVGISGMADCASTAHLLASGKPDEVIYKANANALKKAKANPNASIDMAEEIRSVEREIAAERQAKLDAAKKRKEEEEERERRKAKRRAALGAEVRYRSTSVGQGHGASARGSQRPGRTMTWGRHKGKQISEVPTDYLKWVVKLKDAKDWQTGPCWNELNRRGKAPARQMDADRINQELTESAEVPF